MSRNGGAVNRGDAALTRQDENGSAEEAVEAPLAPLGAAARLSLRDHVRQALRLAIIGGRFRKGEKLNERKLAEDLAVSTTPLKEALRQLEAEGLIETLPRRGLIIRYDRAFAEEMILTRAVLESTIAALAAKRRTPEQATRLKAVVRLMGEATTNGEIVELIALNEQFHNEIHIASGSVHMARLVDQQRLYDDGARRIIHSDRSESATALAEHSDICDAIIAGDSARAETVMRKHVLRSGERYLKLAFGDHDERIA
jgi:DNA-binding GntR family transcriptional regulator